MKKALICPNEPVDFFDGKTGYRVAQTEPSENIFGVADPLYWTDCSDEVVADQWYYDPVDQTIKEVPIPTPVTINVFSEGKY
jgi:hypothetical protein